MKLHTKLITGFLLSACLINTSNADDRQVGLAAMSLADTCLAQDEQLTRDSFRKMFLEVGSDQPTSDSGAKNELLEELKGLPKEELERRYQNAIWGLVDSPWAVCVRKKQWLSKSLCEDFIPILLTQSLEHVPELIEKHRTEILSKKEVFDWMDKAFGSKTPRFTCPE